MWNLNVYLHLKIQTMKAMIPLHLSCRQHYDQLVCQKLLGSTKENKIAENNLNL